MAELSVKDVKKDIYLVLHKAQEMLELTEDGFMKNKIASLDRADALAGEIRTKEDALTASLAKMAGASSEARALLAVPGHIEKVSADIGRISDSSRTRIKEGLLFSDKAIAESAKLFAKSKELLKKTGEAAVTGAQTALNTIVSESDALGRMANEYATAHEERLVTGECSPKSSSTYLCILYAFEDMGASLKDAVRKLAAQ